MFDKPEWMRQMVTLAALLAGSYLLVCLLAYLYQAKLVFFPQRTLLATPATVGLEHHDLTLLTEDGVKIHAWYVPAPEPSGAILFCHGNAGNISHRLDSIRIFHELGYSVLIFDYRGYGRSEGRASEEGSYADARAAWRHLVEKEGFRAEEIALFGRSLGCAVAVELATHVRPRALVVESSFPSIPSMGAHAYPWLPVKLLARIGYDAASRIGSLSCPKLFIHSKQDEVVPYRLGRRLYNIAPEPKLFLEIWGDHNSGFLTTGSLYFRSLESFLRSGALPDMP